MRREKKSEELSPKIEPLPGSLMAQYKRCGRSNCRCASGSLHGPYYYRVWYVYGTRYKQYVKKADLSAVSAGIQAYKQQQDEARAAARYFVDLLNDVRSSLRRQRALIRDMVKEN